MTKLLEKFYAPESQSFLELGTLNTYINHYSYLIARKSPDLYGDFDNIFFDGIAIAIFSHIFGIKKKRASFDMTSMASLVFSLCEKEGYSIFFIGGEPGVALQAADRIKATFNNLNFIGCAPGFFSSNDCYMNAIQEILELNPDFVICGMGTPHQDRFLVDLRTAGWKGTGFTCGGFLRQTAQGGVNYYPALMDRLNIRWLYRIYDEPQLVPRYTTHFLRFILIYARDLIRHKLNPHS